ncbi:MAG: hypothetical protein A2W18_10520, partial [Candidatus Muproteobacteria bacterium RBG_16_60_9]
MAAIISGNELGLFTNPLAPRNDPNTARPGQSDSVYVNSATGNLVIQARDEYLSTTGVDLALLRTYNSQGQFSDDNQDNWRLSVHRRVYGLTGTANTAGSTITKEFGDGAQVTYTYSAALGHYISSDGDGAHDTLKFNPTTQEWTWTDGSRRLTETYNSTGQLIDSRDPDGNLTTYGYTGNLLTQITDPSGQVTTLAYTGTNLTEIRVSSQGQTQTLTRYTYDVANRLSQVTVDLSPNDNAITDGKTYVTTYAYDGTSKRIASIAQGDGSTIAFTYELINGQYLIKSYTDGEGKITTLTYTQGTGGAGGANLNANNSVLSTTVTETTTVTVPPYYLVQAGDTWEAITTTLYGSSNVADELQSVLGNPTLATGTHLTGLPASLTDTQAATATHNLNPAYSSGGNFSPVTNSYYDDNSRLIGTLHADGSLTTFQYDAQGALLTERHHATTPQTPLWYQDFSIDASGFDVIHPGFMTLENGGLTVSSQNTDYTWAMSFGTRTYDFSDFVIYRAEITLGASATDRFFNFGAENISESWRHAAYIEGDQLYSNFYDQGDWTPEFLGTLDNNTTYVIEVATHASGSTLYVYEKGTDRQGGYIDNRTYTGWVDARTFFETHGDDGIDANSIRLDNISESTSLGALIGPYIAVESAQDTFGSGGSNSYTIQAGDTWASIAATLYGTSNVADELQAALGNPTLTVGNNLTNLPASLTDTVTTTTNYNLNAGALLTTETQTNTITVPPYYLVQAADTWATITQAIYGTSDPNAIAALQNAPGMPAALTTGDHLTVPQVLSYGGSSIVAIQADITDP